MTDATIVALILLMSIIVGVPGTVGFAYAMRNGKASMTRDRLVARVFELEKHNAYLESEMLKKDVKIRDLEKRVDDLQIAYDTLLRKLTG